ncbi:3-phosphoshikimate 1-carboxyvinyltransferase [Ameyamaea chiangmaiensis NBRC 103196]|uniref:3-phosphoshikimate 1-carboxyvinyltransferase n=1 Tax=Ameyamaea chiangmaiensis TaxID=442969 RepID=A0A850P7K9_9PROT|nr:3-phosphoshikimate 1-carboxyvinyltransferase [Ameyamaea chiangmaiensis]MBS4075912.1 3-phosphoshikimate 1-carboxyvinyltransferase [Ameyamaea chiangmaiensis]NVN40595.1 3-phosphoshikimate 1-carboxyvinyltransferase [Ameyamaea chiangmaiensis]GBQ61755.1 3-phosphoshikimate 1-carboxyvinyltransferase [Ameyamaea chiangmaiensis NBRC 103196]
MEKHASPTVRPLVSTPPAGPLSGVIRVPGDKSISHRSLMFAGLARGRTEITGLLEGEDVLRTADAMRALGATITREADGRWVVEGQGLGALREPEDVLDMGNSGTAARLLAGILASHGMVSVMTGDASLRRRPMKRVTDPLSACGATFVAREGGRLPLCIQGVADPKPLDYRLPVASAQVKSAVLLAGLNASGTTRVEEPSATRDHTENMLRHFGATVHVAPLGERGRVVTLEGRPDLVARDILVPGDPSSAAFVIVAALLVPGSSVTINGVGLNPLRTGLFDSLRDMGADLVIENARVEGGEPVGDITATAGALHAVDVPAARAPSMIDEYPVLAVAAAHASGVSRFRGLEELRVKESDRLSATVALLRVNGVEVEVEGDDMIVHGTGGAVPGGGTVETRMDHRLAMSASVLGLVARAPVRVDDTAFIDTSFPGYLSLMTEIGAEFG